MKAKKICYKLGISTATLHILVPVQAVHPIKSLGETFYFSYSIFFNGSTYWCESKHIGIWWYLFSKYCFWNRSLEQICTSRKLKTVWIVYITVHLIIVIFTHLPWKNEQTIYSDQFSWMKSLVFWLKFHWSLFHYDDVIMTMLASQITSLTVVYSIVYSGVNQRKHQSSASLAFVREIHRGPVNFPHKWPVTRKMFPFDDVIMPKGPFDLSLI